MHPPTGDNITVRRFTFTESKCNPRHQPTKSSPSKKEVPRSRLQDLPTLKTFGIDSAKTQSEFEAVQEISGTYRDDYNIIDVHHQILQKFSNKSTKLESFRQKKQVEEDRMTKPQSMVERKTSQRVIDDLDKQIKEIITNSEQQKYIDQSSGLLSAYTDLGHQPKVVSLKMEEKEKILDPQQSLRQTIIARYLDVARQYIEIDITQDIQHTNSCPGCGASIDDLVLDETGLVPGYCSNCGMERSMVSQSSCYQNQSRANTSSRNNYEDRDNFFKAMKRYQGKQPNKIPPEIYRQLDKYFADYGLPDAEEIKKRPLDRNGRREGTNRDMLFKALFDIGRSSYYEDVNLIGNTYWGWELPDISHLEDAIMDDYDASQRVFERTKTERKSCLNSQYRLFRHLRKLNYPCSEADFKIVTTREILEYHENMWKIMCDELGWKFVDTI